MLGHKTSINTFKNIQITSGIFSDYNAMKLEINQQKKTEKHTKTWKLNNILQNNEWVNDEIKKEIKRLLETNNEITTQNL